MTYEDGTDHSGPGKKCLLAVDGPFAARKTIDDYGMAAAERVFVDRPPTSARPSLNAFSPPQWSLFHGPSPTPTST